jgi:hypothetical protein
MALTADQILALAPDAASASAGRSLSSGSKWSNLGANPDALWGECQGSGSKPYQAQVDLSEPAFKCSCPSRKFPCKHGLALYLLFAAQPAKFTADTAPDWVTTWLDSRRQRAEKAAEKAVEKAAAPEKAVDLAAQAKRAAQREQKVAAGLDELELWLTDLIRAGLAHARQQPYGYWDTMAKRLVDAQAPGLARRVKALVPGGQGSGWDQDLLHKLGSLHLLVQAARRLEELPPGLRDDVRTLIGWTTREEELLSQTGVHDEWWVVGQTVELEENLRVIRSWLYGRTHRQFALILQFAYPSQTLAPAAVPGTKFHGELVYFPASVPLRAIIKARTEAEPLEHPSLEDVPPVTISANLESYADTLASNPWQDTVPMLLTGAHVLPAEIGWSLAIESESLPLHPDFQPRWHLLAASGGRPLTLWGTWNGQSFRPFGAASPEGYVQLEGRWSQ